MRNLHPPSCFNVQKMSLVTVSNTLPDLLTAIHSLAVIPVATGVLSTELLQLRQEHDEPFCPFTARVRGKAESCAFTTKYKCGKNDYTDHVKRDVPLNGISDPDIHHEVLETKNVLQTPVNDIITLVENKEMACNARSSSTLSAVTLAGSQFLTLADNATWPSKVKPWLSPGALNKAATSPKVATFLQVITDHKPLVKIFGDQTWDEITNSQLFPLKQRTLPWHFDIKHLPGKTNRAADATSKHPSPSGSENSTSLGVPSIPHLVESVLMAFIRQDTQDIGIIAWSLLHARRLQALL